MSENIKLKFQDMKGTIEIELPPKPQLLKDTLKLLHNNTDIALRENPLPFNYNPIDITEKISKELLHKKGFNRLFKKLCSDYGDKNYKYIKIANKAKIEEEHIIPTIDLKELKIASETAFDNINKQNVKLMIIHVASGIPEFEKDIIIDKITRNIQLMTTIKFKSKTRNKYTLIEIIYFGIEIEKQPDFMIF